MSKEKPVKRTRTVRNFPASTFSEAEQFAKSVFEVGAGQSVKRLTLFDQLGKSPDSGPSRTLITNAGKYGLTKGSYKAEEIELTSLGQQITSENVSQRDREAARIQAAITDITPFKGVYDTLVGNKLPTNAVLSDKVKDFDVTDDAASEAVDTFIINLRDVGLLQTLSGAERVVSIQSRLDELPSAKAPWIASQPSNVEVPSNNPVITSGHAAYETTAFYVTPIGEVGSPQRRHADMFAASIVEPAIESTRLNLVRADQIESPGIITKQIIEYLVHSRLVIADLSFHNPNVFYELAVRHMLRKPTVQLMRKVDRIPFDVSQNRTVIIDEEDKYDLIAKMPTFVADLGAQVRQALDNADAADNPISIYVPNLHIST